MTTRDGFLTFLRGVVGISTAVLPDASPAIGWAYNVAIEVVTCWAECIAPTIYDLMVYNLATHNLIEFAQDTPPSTYFADARKTFGLGSFLAGVISASSDETTSQTLLVPDFLKTMSLADLDYLKTPFGRVYLQFAQRFGSTWGIS